jgi:hypothetical protein
MKFIEPEEGIPDASYERAVWANKANALGFVADDLIEVEVLLSLLAFQANKCDTNDRKTC